GLDRAGQRAGMRQRRLPARFRLAELEGYDFFAGGAREAAGGLEFLEVRDRLDIDDDDLQLGLRREERDVVANRQSRLVAAGDQIFGKDAALLERHIGEDHHAAALPDQCDRTLAQRERAVLGERDEAALGADVA